MNEQEGKNIIEKAKKYDELLIFPEIQKELCCTFCGKSQLVVQKLISSKFANICNECIVLCVDILKEDDDKTVYGYYKVFSRRDRRQELVVDNGITKYISGQGDPFDFEEAKNMQMNMME